MMNSVDHPKHQVLKSGPSIRPLHVRFKNCTERNVEILWINYDGVRVPYKTLTPQKYFDVDTFVNHIWIFRDSLTHEKMVVSKREIFKPNPWDVPDGPPSPNRKVICIMLPMFTLKEICFQQIRNCLSEQHININCLNIPLTLKKDYLNYIELLQR